MGVDPFTAALILGGSTAAKHANAAHASRKRDRILSKGISDQGEYQESADRRLNDYLTELRASNPERLVAEAAGEYTGELRGAPGIGGGVPGASSRFREDLGAEDARVRERGDRLAHIFSRIDAPRRQRRGEAEKMGRTATDVRRVGRDAEGADYLTRLRASRVRENPWINALASIGQGYAFGNVLGGGGAGLGGTTGGLGNFYGATP